MWHLQTLAKFVCRLWTSSQDLSRCISCTVGYKRLLLAKAGTAILTAFPLSPGPGADKGTFRQDSNSNLRKQKLCSVCTTSHWLQFIPWAKYSSSAEAKSRRFTHRQRLFFSRLHGLSQSSRAAQKLPSTADLAYLPSSSIKLSHLVAITRFEDSKFCKLTM